MKLQHYAIIFLMIILPMSIVCRISINDKIDTIDIETRLNHALDTATFDAIDTIRDMNDEFSALYGSDAMFEITPEAAMEGINAFYRTLSVNFNLPFAYAGDDFTNEYYFSPYVPAVLVIAYDGFYVYSMEQQPSGAWEYTLSPKIPYAEELSNGYIINYSLGNYIGLYAPNGRYYNGPLSKNYIDDARFEYDTIHEAFLSSTLDYLPQHTSDMSTILYAIVEDGTIPLPPSFLLVRHSTPGAIPMLQDYEENTTDPLTQVSEFHRHRREVIINLIVATLNEKMNQQNRYADTLGITYDFFLPEIKNADWINSIDDMTVMGFLQGVPIGNKSYYNSYALGGSRIVRTNYIYGTNVASLKDPSYNTGFTDYTGHFRVYSFTNKIYHKKTCPLVKLGVYGMPGEWDFNHDEVIDSDDAIALTNYVNGMPFSTYDEQQFASYGDVDGNGIVNSHDATKLLFLLDDNISEIFINRVQAAKAGYYPCILCSP